MVTTQYSRTPVPPNANDCDHGMFSLQLKALAYSGNYL